MRRLGYDDWTPKVMIASTAERAITPMLEERKRFGINAHALLSTIGSAGPGVEAAIEAFLEKEKIEAEERGKLRALAHEVLTRPDMARFFDPAYRYKNECDLTDGSETGRPDRVVFAPGETWVVDYKTGSDHGYDYDKQVRRYCRAVSAMGYPKVSGWLLFLQPPVHIRQVSLEEDV